MGFLRRTQCRGSHPCPRKRCRRLASCGLDWAFWSSCRWQTDWATLTFRAEGAFSRSLRTDVLRSHSESGTWLITKLILRDSLLRSVHAFEFAFFVPFANYRDFVWVFFEYFLWLGFPVLCSNRVGHSGCLLTEVRVPLFEVACSFGGDFRVVRCWFHF